MSDECDPEEMKKALQSIFRILDSLKYEHEARIYTLNDDEMEWVFLCRDLAESVIKGKNK